MTEKTIIFHCGEEYHIETSSDYGYISELKKDHGGRQAYIVCKLDGTILEEHGWTQYIAQTREMVNTLKTKNGNLKVYNTGNCYYRYNGEKCY